MTQPTSQEYMVPRGQGKGVEVSNREAWKLLYRQEPSSYLYEEEHEM